MDVPAAQPIGAHSAPSRRSQAERSDQTISALRSVALQLLLKGGVVSLNLAELGDKAGYSRGIVHYHFGSKEDLLVDLLQSLIDTSVQSFADVTAPGRAGVMAIIDRLIEAIERRPDEVLAKTVLLNEAAASNSERLRELVNFYNQHTRDALDRQMRNDPAFDAAGISTTSYATLAFATMRGIHQQWLAARDAFDVLEALRALRSLIQLHLPG